MLPWNPPPSAPAAGIVEYRSPAGPSNNNVPGYNPMGEGGGAQPHASNQAQQQPLQQQGPQQQQPYHQQQHQQQGQPQHSPQQAPPGPPAPPVTPPITLSATLHFLQSEHRRYARDRNEWEIERAEMRARIALLEGEKRGNEGALRDLGRRCKMLEVALRGERSKFLSGNHASVAGLGLGGSGSGATPSVSGTSSPVPAMSVPLSKPATSATEQPSITLAAPVAQSVGLGHPRTASSMSLNGLPSGSWGGAGGLGIGGTAAGARDPRGKARSRDYLKQCLQEITYLTSSATLNPLSATSHAAPSIPRPRKVLPDTLPPPPGPNGFNLPGIINASSSSAAGGVPRLAEASFELLPPTTAPPAVPITSPTAASIPLPVMTPTPIPSTSVVPPPPTTNPSDPPSSYVPLKRQVSQQQHTGPVGIPDEWSRDGTSTTRRKEPSSPRLREDRSRFDSGDEAPSSSADQEAESRNGKANAEISPKSTPASPPMRREVADGSKFLGTVENGQMLTAIYKPESSEGWQERLREAGRTSDATEDAEEGSEELPIAKRVDGRAGVGEGEEVERGDWEDEEEGKEGSGKVWKAKKSLRSHLDAVRSVAFGEDDTSVVSGSDDMTIKLWRFSPNSTSTDIEPEMTLRGHSGGVTTVLISPSHIYSASFDSTIKSWSIPPLPGPPYMPYDSSINDATLVGHSDVVWGLTMLPNEVLGSAGADGTIKIWDLKRTEDNPLMRSWGYDGVSEGNGRAVKKKKKVVPTALIGVGDKVVVAYADAVVKVFGVESGKEVLRMKSAETYDGTTGSQINAVVVHPTLPIIATAHEDKWIRLFSSTTGECTHSILAHLDGVTSLSFSPSGTSLVSVGHDLSIRFWDIKNLSCEAEIESHKVKGSEGILDVKWGKEGVVTAGADGVVKVWGT